MTARHRRTGVAVVCVGLLFIVETGCATVRMERPVTILPGEDDFEKALMRYVRGELEEAEADLVAVLERHSRDLRARDLLHAVRKERGTTGRPAPPEGARGTEGPLAPDAVIEEVLARNPEMRQAVFGVIENRARMRVANVSFGPEFSVLTRFHPLGLLTSLTQSVIEGTSGRKALLDETEQGVLASLAVYAAVRADVMDRTMAAWLDLQEAEGMLPAIDAERQAWEEQVEIAARLVGAGTLLPSVLLDKKAGLSQAERRLAQAKGQASVARATLDTLMARDTLAPLSLGPLHILTETPAELTAAIAGAKAKRPELAEAVARVEEARAEGDVRSSKIPQIDLRASYGWTEEKQESEIGRKFRIGAKTTIPLLIFPLERAQSHQEEAIVRQLEMEVERLTGTIALEVVAYHEGLRDALASSAAAGRTVEAAQEAVRALEAADRWAGLTSPVTLLETRVRLEAARQEAVRRAIDAERAALRLQRAMGVLPEKVLFERHARRDGGLRVGRAMWVSTRDIATADVDMLFEFLAARGVETVFLALIVTDLAEGREGLRTFLRSAHERGLVVHACGGEPLWAAPEGRAPAEAFLGALVSFQRDRGAEERFDALHLRVDVEARHDWDGDRSAQLADGAAAFLVRARARARDAMLPFVVDAPLGWGAVSAGTPTLLDLALESADQVVLLVPLVEANPAGAAAHEIERLSARGKRAWIRYDAAPAGSREAGLEDEVSRLEAALRARRLAAGIAIDDYQATRLEALGRPGEIR